jgi:DNA-binding NarL/FixJ family response regulator
MIKVMIVEDQELIRQSLEIILSNKKNINVVGTAKDGLEAVQLCDTLRPDLILLDIRMPKMDGVAACKIIKERYPDIKIIVLTTFDDDEYVFNAIKYGASGYLLKGISIEELLNAINTVWDGGTLITPSIASKLVSFFSQLAKSNITPIAATTEVLSSDCIQDMPPTECKIIQLISQGFSNKEIASKLFLSEGTVRNNISSILTKLNLRDRTQLAIYYINREVFISEDQ